ncbi:aspartate/glutamate racemase family protein [Paracoccus aerodenitrificans]|uniref:aspartate/glutamate racemase family protein n=1 Tax=Paracoccus aerodenitrificans TaxID=3017781 RepID=UPI0022F0876E|nr:aspartate/glutamate racemase family protein [Paracoccus aerodenitrificans]WBU62914.1 aspartate/glutamate racemase family protein [Paracoccus aerodenitrificans]
MRPIGILGGMSWVSTAHYYATLNRMVAERMGGLHSARILMHSVDFATIAQMQQDADWEGAGEVLADAARGLQAAGAGLIVIAANTMHLVADQVAAATDLPLIHIADATADAIAAAGLKRPGLIATAYTMERRFYRDRLEAAGLAAVIPDAESRTEIHRIIFDELVRDQVLEDSRRIYENAAAALIEAGADCIIFGCTEVGLLLNDKNVAAPVFDTVEIHCRAALEAASFETGETYV